MKKLILLLVLLPFGASAQTVTVVGAKSVAWEQPAPSLAEANSYGAVIYVDVQPKQTLTGKTCSGAASPFTCSAPLPALTPGNHDLAVAVTLGGAESAKSSTLAVNVVVLATPQNLTIQ